MIYDQSHTFPGLKHDLETTGRVSDSLAPFRPFLGHQGEIRCETRLQKMTHLAADTRFPILLASKSKLSEDLLRDYHCNTLKHCGGINTLIAEIGKRFLIVGVRRVARKICQTCPRCLRRSNPKKLETIQAHLHPNRGGLALRPFSETGVDMAGPFWVKHGRTRSRIKIYAILFVCCATRAINVEAVEDASSESCRFAFERHCARYGRPDHIYSDNGTNFVGVCNELKAQYQLWRTTASGLEREHREIKWRFAPPYSPRWNGHVEVMVKLLKREMKHLLDTPKYLLTSEEFVTICTTAASFINRRPLVQVGSMDDPEVLTPAHFLLAGNPHLGFRPQLTADETLAMRKNRLDMVSAELWNRLTYQYIISKAKFDKQTRALTDSLQVGELVLVLNEPTDMGLWPIGRVLETRPGVDGVSRKFRLQVGSNCAVVRGASSLAKFPVGPTLSPDCLLFCPTKLWPGRGGGETLLADRRERALRVLETRAEFEDAKRMFQLHYGKGKAGRQSKMTKNVRYEYYKQPSVRTGRKRTRQTASLHPKRPLAALPTYKSPLTFLWDPRRPSLSGVPKKSGGNL